MITYQDYVENVLEGTEKLENFIARVINNHISSDMYLIAEDADEYNAERNSTIMRYVQYMYSATGRKSVDIFASNNKLCSNFFRNLNTQRCNYLLGNGVNFSDNKDRVIDQTTGAETTIDRTKERLGKNFDTKLKKLAYLSLIHGVGFGYWNYDHLEYFSVREFAPLWDEETSDLRAGIRFWQIASDKPIIATFFEEDGYSVFRKGKKDTTFVLIQDKKAYITTTYKTKEGEVVGYDYSNYNNFPIIPLWGSDLHQSTLVGMKSKIDAYDLISSGFANDLQDCAEIYWIVSGGAGMDNQDLAKFRQRLKLNKIANVEDRDSSATPYTQEIPYASREAFLARIEAQIYRDFSAFRPEQVAAGNVTATQIESAYQPMDDVVDDFEYQVIEFIQSLLKLINIEDTPIFKRNKISNQKEQTEMILECADYLDEETILSKLPFITVDEISAILAKKDLEASNRLEDEEPPTEPTEDDLSGEEDKNDEE
jgi:hypothetical protein